MRYLTLPLLTLLLSACGGGSSHGGGSVTPPPPPPPAVVYTEYTAVAVAGTNSGGFIDVPTYIRSGDDGSWMITTKLQKTDGSLYQVTFTTPLPCSASTINGNWTMLVWSLDYLNVAHCTIQNNSTTTTMFRNFQLTPISPTMPIGNG